MTADRIMIDSANPAAVIAAVRAKMTFNVPGVGILPTSLAGLYTDGRYAATLKDWAALAALGIHPRQQVGITVLGTGGEARKAVAGDTEPGDMDPAAAAAWAAGEHRARHWPVPYCDRAEKPQVISECEHAGLRLGPDFELWVATLDNTFRDLDGSDLRTQHGVAAVQFTQAHSPIWAGGPSDLDVSLVVNAGWRAPHQPPAPPPPPVKALEGYLVTPGQAGGFAGRAVTSPPPPGATQVWG